MIKQFLYWCNFLLLFYGCLGITSQGWGVFLATIQKPDSTNIIPLDGTNNYTFTYRELNNVTKVALVLTNIFAWNQNRSKYTANIFYKPNQHNNFVIVFSVEDNLIIKKISFSVIILTKSVTSFLNLYYQCNQIQDIGYNQVSPFSAATIPILDVPVTLQTIIYPLFVSYDILFGSTAQINIYVQNILPQQQKINLGIQIQSGRQIYQICFTTLTFIDNDDYRNSIFTFNSINKVYSGLYTQFPNDMLNSQYEPYYKNCFVAFNQIELNANHNITVEIIWSISTFSISCSQGFPISISRFCAIDICKSWQTIYNNQCVNCSNIYSYDCYECNDTGCIRQCPSNLQDCGRCINATQCVQCINNLYLNLSTQKCQCKGDTWRVTNTCTNITGCLSSQMVAGKAKCYYCDHSKGFILTNNNCYCSEGYFNNNTQCIIKCGDGLVNESQCDDGNNMNNDGCSSQCQIQSQFQCINQINIIPQSICIAIPFQLTFDLLHIWKQPNQNTAQITILIKPIHQILSRINWTNYNFIFLNNFNHTITQIIYFQGKLKININFYQDAESQILQIKILKKQLFFLDQNIDIKFKLYGYNAPLIISQTNQLYNLINYIAIAVVILSGIVFLLSLPIQRTIGLQAIQLTQFMFLSLLSYPRFVPILMALIPLKYSIGLSDIRTIPLQNYIQLKDPYRYLNFTVQYLQYAGISTMIVLIVTIALFISYAYYQYKRKQFQQSIKRPEQSYLQILPKLHYLERMLWMICIFLTPLTIISITIVQHIINTVETFLFNLKINQIVLTITTIIIISVLIHDIMNLGQQRYLSSTLKNNHSNIFTIYTFILTIIIINIKSMYLISIIIIMYIIYLIIRKPYYQNIHNIAAIFNQIILLKYFLSIIYISIKPNNQNILIILIYIDITMIIISNISALCRLIYYYNSKRQKSIKECKTNSRIYKQKKQIKQISINFQEEQEEINRYRIQNQLRQQSKKQLIQWLNNRPTMNQQTRRQIYLNTFSSPVYKYEQESNIDNYQSENLRNLKARLRKQFKQKKMKGN